MYEHMTLISITKAKELKNLDSDVTTRVNRLEDQSIQNDLGELYRLVSGLKRRILRNLSIKDHAHKKAS